LNPFEPKGTETNADEFRKWNVDFAMTPRFAMSFSRTNALTQDGRLVNLDATGNRVAACSGAPPLRGHRGKNKIVKDLDEALERIRKVIAPTISASV